MHVHAHGTSVCILVGEHFFFINFIHTFLWKVSCIFSVDSWCGQCTCLGNHCQISTTRQAAMLKHKCMKPVLSTQILMYNFYRKFHSHFMSIKVCCRVLLLYSCGTSEAWESDKQFVEC